MVILISYRPGLSGDFLAHTIHKNPGFKRIDDSVIDSYNRYFMPELLFMAHGSKENAKTWDSPQWPEDLDHSLWKVYREENICVTTHWSHNPESAYFADHKVLLYTEDELTSWKAYACWWIKSHAWCSEPWTRRVEEVRSEMPPEIAEDLLANYQNWKFLSYRMGIYPYDLKKYMKMRYDRFYKNTRNPNNYQYDAVIDIKDIFNRTVTNVVGQEIDEESVINYVIKNDQLLDSFEIELNGSFEQFIDSLCKSVEVRYELFKRDGVDQKLYDVKSVDKWLR